MDAAPEPHDIVACTDVLEHIEPDCLDDVLKDIRRCTKKVAFLLIATRPAIKVLADGRNAHLIQQPYTWWRTSHRGMRLQDQAGE
jgi:2-polyprenyl-3-methyl-5-hydroxy-6-metoxy-1,4-benzoquinol methylase